MRIALTHSEGALPGLEQALVERGHEVVRRPLIRTEALADAPTRAAARALLACRWLLFTSPAAADAWRELELPLAGIAPLIGAVGPGTARALTGHGGRVDLVSEAGHARDLAEAFVRHPAASGPVGLPRGDLALPTLPEFLAGHGFEVRPVTVYQTRTLPWEGPAVEVVLVASPSAVRALPAGAAPRRIVALGATTAAAARDAGLDCTVAPHPDTAGVLLAIAALENYD